MKGRFSPSLCGTLLSGERERRIALAVLGSVGAKLVSVFTLLISVPWTLHYLGTERYGMWVTMSSFAVMVSFADFGVGNGLMSALARASGRNDPDEMRTIIGNGLAAMLVVATLGAIAASAAFLLVDWPGLFNVVSPLAREEARPAAGVFLACTIAGIPASIGLRIITAMQRGALNGMWSALSSLLALFAVILAIHLQLALPWLVLAFVGVPLLVSASVSVSLLSNIRLGTAPRFSDVTLKEAAHLVRTGLLFFVLQVVSSVTYVTDNIVIAQVVGPRAVAMYSVADRLFSLIAVLMMMANSPLWPAYAEAHTRGDSRWIATTFRRSLAINFALPAAAAAMLLIGHRFIFEWWVGASVMPTLPLLVALSVRRVVETMASACSMLLNGLHVVRFQILWGLLMMAAALSLRIVMVRAIGPAGAAWGVVIAVVLFGLIPNFFYIPRLLRGESRRFMSPRLTV